MADADVPPSAASSSCLSPLIVRLASPLIAQALHGVPQLSRETESDQFQETVREPPGSKFRGFG